MGREVGEGEMSQGEVRRRRTEDGCHHVDDVAGVKRVALSRGILKRMARSRGISVALLSSGPRADAPFPDCVRCDGTSPDCFD